MLGWLPWITVLGYFRGPKKHETAKFIHAEFNGRNGKNQEKNRTRKWQKWQKMTKIDENREKPTPKRNSKTSSLAGKMKFGSAMHFQVFCDRNGKTAQKDTG
mgnify:CR=1 FL=1